MSRHRRAMLLCAALLLAGCASSPDRPSVSDLAASPLPRVTPSASPTAEPSHTAEPSPTAEPLPTAEPSPTPAPQATVIFLVPQLEGLVSPIGLVNAADGSGRLFAIEQGGIVRTVSFDAATAILAPDPFLDLADRVSAGGERGLLGLAFHPDFETNRRVFAHYTDLVGNTVIAEYAATADGQRADPASERILVQVVQPFPNHNGGMIAFGADRRLYIALGDGGSGGDPLGTGQDTGDLLAAILRLDVDSPVGTLYAIPPDNPFADGASGAPEVWDYGLRNPWRFSFDRATGDVYIGDVGQGGWEEIDLHPAGTPGGLNYGWDTTEGRHCFAAETCDQAGLTAPVAEYPLDGSRCAVIGGYVYRGERYPSLSGMYLFADHCSGEIWAMTTSTVTEPVVMATAPLRISSFGEDEAGELYVVDRPGGGLYRVADRPAGASP